LIKIIASIAVAIMVGVMVMFIPIMVFTTHLITTSQEVSPQNEPNFTRAGTQPLNEAAQTYGKIDTGPAPFPTSLLHAFLVAATGFSAALGISQFFKRKIK